MTPSGRKAFMLVGGFNSSIDSQVLPHLQSHNPLETPLVIISSDHS